jgi:hypothetical protein
VAGRERGRGAEHFRQEGSLVLPELADRDRTFRNKLLTALVAKGE